MKISVRVENAGNAPVSGFTVGLYDAPGSRETANHLAAYASGSSLSANNSRDISLGWRVEAKWNPNLKIIVDQADEIAESDEDNNSAPVVVNPITPPFSVSDIEWQPKTPTLNEEVMFWANVRNSGGQSSDHDVAVAFYMNGENIYWTSLDDLPTGKTKQVSSESWKARDGTYEIAVAVYPSEYLNYRVSAAFDKRYAISFAEDIYNHTALPNLTIGDVNVIGRKQTYIYDGPNAPTPTPSQRAGFYLDVEYWLRNSMENGSFSSPVKRPFNVQVKWDKGAACPFWGKTMPRCFISTTFNRFDSGAERREQVRSSNPLTLPTQGIIEYRLIIVVDPSDAVKETDENDNRYELHLTVDSDGTIRQTVAGR